MVEVIIMGMIKTGVAPQTGSIKMASSGLRKCPHCASMIPNITGVCPKCKGSVQKVVE